MGAPPAAVAILASGRPQAKARGAVTVRGGGEVAYRLQVASPAAVPFTKARLKRIMVYLDDLSAPDGPQLRHDLTPASFDDPLDFDGLLQGHRYRVTMKAFGPETNGPNAPNVEAQADEASSLAFEVGPQEEFIDLNARGGLILTLRDRSFQGQGQGGIQLQPGLLESTQQAEGLVHP